MKCYYEILGIARDADDSEIKIAYRKLALKWHPDKNIENTEYAKEQFQLVQQAYEVLSDRQERAWYDNHREQILRGADSNYTDDSLDVFPYFSSQCFFGYGDDERSFYTVYRKVFEKIANEDMQHVELKQEFLEIPSFGCSTSDYKEIVAPFYAYWSHYSTKKSYVWLDPYNINDTVNRRHARLVEKENKKIRQKAKKERNEEIQNLVAFVRKRDKRVQAHAKLVEATKAERRKKQEELRKQKILDRKKELHEDTTQAEWSKFDNVKDELKQIEKSLAEEFGESMTDSDGSEAEEEYDNPDELFCAACNKRFKSNQARVNHDSSKKHRENLSNLIKHLQESEELYNELNKETTDEEDATHKESENISPVPLNEVGDADIEETINEAVKVKKNKNKKVIRVNDHPTEKKFDSDEEFQMELEDVLGSSKKQKKQNKQKNKQNGFENGVPDEETFFTIDSSDVEFVIKKNKKKKQKSKQNPVVNGMEKEKPVITTTTTTPNQIKVSNKKSKSNKKDSLDTEPIDTSHCCAKCHSIFESKNKLFEHLKKTGHSIALSQKDTKTTKRIK